MQCLPRGDEPVCKGVNGSRIHQIKRLGNHAWRGCERAFRFRKVPSRDNDFCACGKKSPSGLKAYPRIAPRNDGNLSGQVNATNNFRSSRLRAETGIDRMLRSVLRMSLGEPSVIASENPRCNCAQLFTPLLTGDH